jgi:inner membrane transporter RhtA
LAASPPNANRLAALLPVLLLLAAMASVQFGATIAKGLFQSIGPQGATSLRLAFSALIVAVVQRPWRSLKAGRPLLSLLAYGAVLGAMNTVFYMALRRVPLGIAVALEFAGPLAVAVAGSRRWLDGLWLALAVGGLAVLLPLRHTAQAIDPTGAALALAAGVCWALYILIGRRVARGYGAGGAGLGMIIAAVLFAPLDAAQAGPGVFALAVLPAGLLLALLSSAVPYTLEMVALARIPAPAFGALMSLEPAVGALAGLVVLGENPAPIQWAGIGAIILASLGTALTLKPDAQPAPN